MTRPWERNPACHLGAAGHGGATGTAQRAQAGPIDVVAEHLMTGGQQGARHGAAHDAQADDADSCRCGLAHGSLSKCCPIYPAVVACMRVWPRAQAMPMASACGRDCSSISADGSMINFGTSLPSSQSPTCMGLSVNSCGKGIDLGACEQRASTERVCTGNGSSSRHWFAVHLSSASASRHGAGQPAPRCPCLVADSLAWPACPPRCAESIAERRMGRASSEAKALAFARSRSFAATPLRWNSGATKR